MAEVVTQLSRKRTGQQLMARMSEAAKARGNEASLARHNQLIEHGLCCACKKPREPERRLKTRCNACAAKARA